MNISDSGQRAYWDDLAKIDPDAAIIDPNDLRGHKNAYLASIRDRAFRQSLARHGITSGTLLDVGCGTGSATMPLLRDGHRVLGFDISLGLLRHARARCGNRDCLFVATDGHSLPFANASFEAAIIYSVLCYLVDDDAAGALLSNIHATLKPGAPLIMIEQTRTKRRILEQGRKVQRTRDGWLHLLENAGFRVEKSTILRHGRFPTTPLVRMGMIPRSLWPTLRQLESSISARYGIFGWDYAEICFETHA